MPASASSAAAELRAHTRKHLAKMAQSAGVEGWHGMRKEELIAALTKAGATAAKNAHTPKPNSQNGQSQKGRSQSPRGRGANAASKPSGSPPRVKRKLAALQAERRRLRDISTGDETTADRLLLLVRDPYWLHLSWEVQPESVRRARTALGQLWHTAEPALRIHRLHPSGASGGYKQQVIHGGVRHWYVDVQNPPGRYRAELGYAASSGEFYCICKSNEAATPEPTAPQAVDDNWNDVARNADQVYAMSGGYSADGVSSELREALETRLQRRLGRPTDTRLASSMVRGEDHQQPLLRVEAEMLLHGEVAPHTHLTIKGEPVEIAADNTFAVKVALPDRRQVAPIVASSADGARQQTIIVGVDKNTKTLAPPRRDAAAS